ncbi:glycosyltransferase family 2 protein [Flavobacterium sp.]|jgi:glycosyltransferase involved in cell wall biosynthesis|uniref:glycosyltransferase family 2 protein n=1 Tax=Flavobacterium sp. TaxID=239 RepID=UPI0037C10849
MQNPLISIIIPCYNQGRFLNDALDSVIGQDYQNWECIVVNDGSIDNTEEVALLYCDKDSRIKYVYKKNGGLSSARNTGINLSNGKYILPLDSDDKISSEYCKIAVQELESNDQIKIVYCRANFFGVKSGEWLLPDFSIEKILGQNIIFCSGFFRRSDYNLTSGYNENMKFGLEDWDFWLSLLELGGEVFKIDKVLFFYRIRIDSMARSLDDEKNRILRKQLWTNHKKIFSENFLDPTLTFEYLNYANSFEYKVGNFVVKPLRKIMRYIYKFFS